MEWKEENNQLNKEFVFKDFRSAMAFMQLVAFEAEALDHHPDWSNAYNRVKITLCTHHAGNVVTELDRKLASEADRIYHTYFDRKEGVV
ncbi:MAG: 4a-hydroxytetrahydrobiopterin dehydratase [Saprospiraceae bacterium]|nr:4a-hydroxytetrahydrobiopterin dehydratase [Saprospiraceae bacterium]